MCLSMSLVSSESLHQSPVLNQVCDGEDFQPSKSPAVLRMMIFIIVMQAWLRRRLQQRVTPGRISLTQPSVSLSSLECFGTTSRRTS